MRQRVERMLGNEDLDILADAELLAELEDVCTRPKFSRKLATTQVADFLQLLRDRLTFIEPQSQVQICRDPDDDYLLAICQDGDVDFLLTGDSDLLTLSSFRQTRILTLTEFESRFP